MYIYIYSLSRFIAITQTKMHLPKCPTAQGKSSFIHSRRPGKWEPQISSGSLEDSRSTRRSSHFAWEIGDGIHQNAENASHPFIIFLGTVNGKNLGILTQLTPNCNSWLWPWNSGSQWTWPFIAICWKTMVNHFPDQLWRLPHEFQTNPWLGTGAAYFGSRFLGPFGVWQ